MCFSLSKYVSGDFFFLFCSNWRAYCNNKKTPQVAVGLWQVNQTSAPADKVRQGLSLDDCLQAENEHVCKCASWNRSKLHWIVKHNIYNPTQHLYPLPTTEGRTRALESLKILFANACSSKYFLTAYRIYVIYRKPVFNIELDFLEFFTALAIGTYVNSVADLQCKEGTAWVSGLGLHFNSGGWKMILFHSAQEGNSCSSDTGMCWQLAIDINNLYLGVVISEVFDSLSSDTWVHHSATLEGCRGHFMVFAWVVFWVIQLPASTVALLMHGGIPNTISSC